METVISRLNVHSSVYIGILKRGFVMKSRNCFEYGALVLYVC